MKNIWQKLKKPIFILAPLDDVTDVVFREIVAKTCPPDLFFTEFTSTDALNSPAGKKAHIHRLDFTQNQKPIIAQIWGATPENYFKAAKLIAQKEFDGIDINMGCPDNSTIKKGACSALINNHPLVEEIVKAVKKGAPNLPLSIKTRIGFRKIQTQEWFSFLLSLNLDAIIVHGRTVSEMSKVPAHWDEIGKVVKLRDQINPKTLIIGNGDVENRQDGLEKVKQYGVDGIMIGRGIFHDMFAFSKNPQKEKYSKLEMLNLLLEHARLFEKTWGKTKNFAILRKFFKIYVKEIEGASNLRVSLMETNNLEDVEKVISNYQTQERPPLISPKHNIWYT